MLILLLRPVLEGGVNGIWLHNPTNAEGSLNITGGTIEGVSGVALRLQSTFLSSVIAGLHLEANGVADVIIENSSNVRLTGILATKLVSIINFGIPRSSDFVHTQHQHHGQRD